MKLTLDDGMDITQRPPPTVAKTIAFLESLEDGQLLCMKTMMARIGGGLKSYAKSSYLDDYRIYWRESDRYWRVRYGSKKTIAWVKEHHKDKITKRGAGA